MARVRKVYFTKEYTNVIKGIAVLMLLSHHLFFGQLSTPIHWFGGDSLLQIFATIFKVCVTLFAIMSGYGLSETYLKKPEEQSNFDFTCSKLKNLLKQYWFIFFIFVPLGSILGHNPVNIYGTGMRGIFFMLIDACGLFPLTGSPTMNYSWWYIEAAIVFYLLFPFIYKIMKKHPWFILLPTYFLNAKYGAAYCREIFWLFPFCVGIYCSQKNTFNRYISKFKDGNEDRKIGMKCKSILWLLFWFIARSKLGIAVDVCLAISIINFASIHIMEKKWQKTTFKILGNHSANIFFIHSFIYYYYSVIATPFNSIPYKSVQYIVLLISSFIVSILIEITKKLLIKRAKEKRINVQTAISTV